MVWMLGLVSHRNKGFVVVIGKGRKDLIRLEVMQGHLGPLWCGHQTAWPNSRKLVSHTCNKMGQQLIRLVM